MASNLHVKCDSLRQGTADFLLLSLRIIYTLSTHEICQSIDYFFFRTRYLPRSLSITSLSLSSIFSVISKRFSSADLIGACAALSTDWGMVKKILLGSSGEEVVVSDDSNGWDDALTVIAINNNATTVGSIFDFFSCILFSIQSVFVALNFTYSDFLAQIFSEWITWRLSKFRGWFSSRAAAFFLSFFISLEKTLKSHCVWWHSFT